MSDEMEVIDLDALINPVGRVKVGGTVYDVHPASGVVADLLQQIADKKIESGQVVDVCRRAAGMCVPAMPAETVKGLNIDQLNSIIAIATRQMDLVKKIIAEHEKNGVGAEMKTATSSAPSSLNQ